MRAETLDETELEFEDESENVYNESFSGEAEEELYHGHEFQQVYEFERDLEREIFSEMQNFTPETYTGFTPETYTGFTPETYTGEAQPSSFTPETYTGEAQPSSFTPETYTGEAQPSSFTPETYTGFTPETYTGFTPETYTGEAQPSSFTPETYTGEAQPSSFTPETYTGEAQPSSFTPETYTGFTPETYTGEAQPSSFTPETYTGEAQPSSFTPETYTGEAQPSSFTPETYTGFTPETYTGFTPETYTGFTPETYTGFTPETYTGFTPETYTGEAESEEEEFVGSVNEALVVSEARNNFINGLLSESPPNLQRLTQEFAPAILPALRIGIRLIGRQRVVGFLATLVAKLLNPLIGQNFGNPLSRVIADAGLRLLTLESPRELPNQNRLVAETIANIVTESIDRVAALPESVLEGEDQVLEAHVQESILESIKENVPGQALGEEFVSKRKLPSNVTWIPRKTYKVLSQKSELILYPTLASRVKSFGGATLLDILRKTQGWDGTTPVRVSIRVFQSLPVGTRLAMIARDYVGGTSATHTVQILPLTPPAAALLLNNPYLARRRRTRKLRPSILRYDPAWRNYYFVKILQAVGRPMHEAAGPLPPASAVRSNDISIRFDRMRLEIRIYLNDLTIRRVKSLAGTRPIAELNKSVVDILKTPGSNVLHKLLIRLKMPPSVSKQVVSLILGLVIRRLNKSIGRITTRISSLPAHPDGITLTLSLMLPSDLISDLPRLTIAALSGNLSKLLSSITLSRIKPLPGYRL